MSYYVPVVVEKTGRGERSYDIYSRLLKDHMTVRMGIDEKLEGADTAVADRLRHADRCVCEPRAHRLRQ